MSRETYAERKAREAVRDQIREMAWDVAQHVARGDMLGVEQTGEAWPIFRFSGPTSIYRCDCGIVMAPLPTFRTRHGILPTWFCPLCGLDQIIAACERIRAESANSQSAPAE